MLTSEHFASITKRPWKSLYTFDIDKVFVDWVREFYCNMKVKSDELFVTYVRGRNITVSPSSIAALLNVEIVDDPICTFSDDDDYDDVYDGDRELYSENAVYLTHGLVHNWESGGLPHNSLADKYQILNLFISSNLVPRVDHTELSGELSRFVANLGEGRSVNVPGLIFDRMIKTSHASKRDVLPYGV